MFRDAKVGDRVWSMFKGWGTISKVEGNMILVSRFKDSGCQWYYFNGNYYREDICPTLFWDEVTITPPPRPKRKVKKVAKGWFNLYARTEIKGFNYVRINPACAFSHDSEEEADEAADEFRLGPAHYIEHPYEVDE